MTSRKFIPLLIIALLLPLVLASCEGIGDGALSNEAQTTAEPSVPDSVEAETDCVLTCYDDKGNGTYRARVPVADMSELMELIMTGEYNNSAGITSSDSYVLLDFPDRIDVDNNVGIFNDVKIYTDDYYVVENFHPDSMWSPEVDGFPIGKIEGIYDQVIQLMNEAKKDISKAESAAGFAFDTLLVSGDAIYSFAASDFEDLGCIGVSRLLYAEKQGVQLWTFTFDSCSEEKIRDIASKLKSHSEITSVEFNYVMSYDW